MFVRCKVLLLLSSLGLVLGVTRNRCHPENGSSACFDPSNACPWSVANLSHRLTLEICPDKRPVAGAKRCASVQPFKCIDPSEPPCTPAESLITQAQIDALRLCTDIEHLYKRCHAKASSPCLSPTEQCFENERKAGGVPTGAALTVCPDMAPIPGIDRCDARQPHRCINEQTVSYPQSTENPNTACTDNVIQQFNLKLCNDIDPTNTHPHQTQRCHPWQATPCIDPKETCPFSLQPGNSRENLPICTDRLFDGTKLRCHVDQRVGNRDNRCLDPTLTTTDRKSVV